MFTETTAYSSFAVDDLGRAEAFYGDQLGLETKIVDADNGLMRLRLGDDRELLVYRKDDYTPATYTILNFVVDDVDATADALVDRGIELELYEGFEQDEKGIARAPGPPMAWFRDPAGNILSVIQE